MSQLYQRAKKIRRYGRIRVKDNGNSIFEKALNKNFQPYFTIKPTGKGQGSEHEGSVWAEIKEGEFTEFMIQLPNNQL